MLNLNTPLTMPESVAFHPLGNGDQTVIVSMASGYLFTGNKTTQAFLEAVDGRRTMEQIIDILAKRFDVERDRLRADMLSLAKKLLNEGLLAAKGDTSCA